MAQTVSSHDDVFVCPYCAASIRILDDGFRLAGRCEHLVRMDGGSVGLKTAHFVAPGEYLVPDADCHRTGAWVYVTPDDPRYARAYEGGHLEPGAPPPSPSAGRETGSPARTAGGDDETQGGGP